MKIINSCFYLALEILIKEEKMRVFKKRAIIS